MFCRGVGDHSMQGASYIEAPQGNHQDLAALARKADKAWAEQGSHLSVIKWQTLRNMECQSGLGMEK